MPTPLVGMVTRTPGAMALLSFALAASACARTTSQVTAQPAATTAAGEADVPAAAKAPTALMATSPDGTKIAYETTGTGPALMLLHGGGQTRRSWNERGYVDRLSKRFTVITVDGGLTCSDTFARIDPILAEVEPFLAANPGTN